MGPTSVVPAAPDFIQRWERACAAIVSCTDTHECRLWIDLAAELESAAADAGDYAVQEIALRMQVTALTRWQDLIEAGGA